MFRYGVSARVQPLQGPMTERAVDAPLHSLPQAAVFINLFVVSVFARGFYGRNDAPEEIGLQNAGEYLGKVGG